MRSGIRTVTAKFLILYSCFDFGHVVHTRAYQGEITSISLGSLPLPMPWLYNTATSSCEVLNVFTSCPKSVLCYLISDQSFSSMNKSPSFFIILIEIYLVLFDAERRHGGNFNLSDGKGPSQCNLTK